MMNWMQVLVLCYLAGGAVTGVYFFLRISKNESGIDTESTLYFWAIMLFGLFWFIHLPSLVVRSALRMGRKNVA